MDIHSLKSMSKAVGATSLVDQAAVLEEAAKDGDIDKIKELFPGFLDDYRGLLTLLEKADL